jgi:Tfp pilus assembly protein PilO
MTDSKEPWHLNKSVPVALICTILFQTVLVVWWAASLSKEVEQSVVRLERAEMQIETMRADSQTQAVQLGRIEEGLSGVREDMARIVRLLEAQQ